MVPRCFLRSCCLASKVASGLVLALLAMPLACVSTPPGHSESAPLPLHAVALHELPAIDAAALRAAAAQASKAAPFQFATPLAVDISPERAGTWETLANGDRLWRLRVHVPGATSLNFGFTHYQLPPGATLQIMNDAGTIRQGPYTAHDKQAHTQLWTPPLPGARAVLVLSLPGQASETFALQLTQVNAGFRDPGSP